ncbi:MAG: 3-isopropylmalate dehydratase small subunit [Alphaproteobacteria bacterium]|jgi:3-isopropylmalate/(R)-2-methylmalate dehydratase small subunit|nr:3-isopropylmalate dehydratase small subunit [Alphaproteobacteria bacterium]MCB1551450.1 3-isopropylmalate dehydratase small subunit [Alphaproteobacteria bacterium]MCB9984468.1 3-isopropylmalate dehydratase small subunit [Micavibrio sp.]HRK97766.1 3-isopropylmalate dehydratase small subunit [Alphaproteobacteria bacterium]HRK98580.1 3-isopropylmalate dehydratase small subunit [Alphaproteobacteria bacterium]
MQAFVKLTSIPAALPLINIDTDMIIPKQFLRTIKRTGLSAGLFYEMRFDEQGNPKSDFVLHREPYTKSTILVTGDNFGCGSSREHAPWALLDFGIRCIIAPSYSDIFFNNCFKNGILPISIPQAQLDELTAAAEEKREITIDLEQQKIVCGNSVYTFDIDPFRKHCLMNGLDDIGLTLEKESLITSYEQTRAQDKPWL